MSDELDRYGDEAMEHDRRIEPSRWFRRTVMRKVHAQAEVPPIAFPWRRLLAGMALALVAAAASLSGSSAAEVPRSVVLLPALVLAFVAAQIMPRRPLRH